MINLYEFEAPQRAAMAASNVGETLLSGIAAVGDLLATAASTADSELDPYTVADTGHLLKAMAELASLMQCVEVNAAHQLRAEQANIPAVSDRLHEIAGRGATEG